MSQKDRLTSLLGLNKDEIAYNSDLDVYIKRLRKIRETLTISDSKQIELILKWLHTKEMTLKTLTAKNRDKDRFEADLNEVLKIQEAYYEAEIYPYAYESACKSSHSHSDVHIHMDENRYRYSVPLMAESQHLWDKDMVLNVIEEKKSELNQYINQTLRLVFVHYFEASNDEILNVKDFDEIVLEAINKYKKVKENKKASDTQQQLNPYLRLYHFMRTAYVNNYYELQLPGKSYFTEFKTDKVTVDVKSIYGLNDVAVVLAKLLTGSNDPSSKEIKKSYERLKKCFQEYTPIQSYKDKQDNYAFTEIATPLSHYLFLRKKSKKNLKVTGYCGVSDVILYRIQPILQSIINGEEDRLKTAFEYIDFIRTEFKDIVESADHRYQVTMLNFWFESIVNIFYRTMGLKSKQVYLRYPSGKIHD
ncbi:hypothetical protein AB1I68_00325 [Paenibacillus pabuli]|uniref:hypothetical protein n=1 Tax=Paenibacillus pabuli TaxID=1472 RepID=UPI0034586855